MKTIEEFIKEIEDSDALKNELKTIKENNALADFLKKHGCEASVKEFTDFMKPRTEGEIEDDEAGAAAGGVMTEIKLSDGTVVGLDLPEPMPMAVDLTSDSVRKKLFGV